MADLRAEVDRLNAGEAELRLEMGGIEKEREFYFDKLREIEMMLQDLEDNGKGNELTASIFEILYATAEGFQPVDEVPGEEDGGVQGEAVEQEGHAEEEELQTF